MAGILDTFTSMIGSGLADKAGKAIGVDPALVTRGLGLIGPVALGGLAKATSSPQGASSFFKMLPEDSGGLLSNLGSLLGGETAKRQATGLEAMFGAGTNAIGATLSDKLGFNV